MRRLSYRFPAGERARDRAHVGQVGSGDCEILLEPAGDEVEVVVRTSVDGFDAVWERVLDTFFARNALAGRYEINDQGATPGVVTLRLRQVQAAAR
jgi:malonate decarboxylase acyl carrier protein